MGKATRIKRETAREKIAAQRAAARKAEIRNRVFITGGSILGVLVILAAFLVFKAFSGSSGSSAPSSATGTALPASVIQDLTTVPAATLESVGSGTAYPKSVSPVSAPPLTSAGKPEVLYIGAEYCPYCATERWAMAVALSRFGTFSGLHGIHSSSSDVYASTPSLTFYKSRYTSKYLTFTPVEEETTDQNTPLQKPTAAQSALAAKYDNPPYTTTQGANAIPFVDFGGKYLVHGAQFNPQLLQGKTWAEVAAALNDGTSQIAQGADGAANMITAAICKMTGSQPSSVCTSPAIKALQGQL
jgi:thiol-disulfide isomerase/thioredoxin